MPDTLPRISVVLATCNGEKFLDKQLASLAAQTRAPHELIVSDDASTDSTPEIVERFRASAPFAVVFHRNERAKGFRENFLSAAGLASGDWIAFCDQDDVWRHDKLEVCAQALSIPGVTQVAHQAQLIDEHDHPFGRFDQGIVQTGLKGPLAYDVWGTFWGFSMLVDRRVLELVPSPQRFVDYIDARHLIAHDRWAFFLAQTLGHTFEIAQPLVGYRQHGRNLYGSGQGPRGKSIASLRQENAVYIAATRSMLQIVEALPTRVEQDFPAFDRARALQVLGRALRQLLGREQIYQSSQFPALCRSLAMLLTGGYRNAQNGALRWRSFLRDAMVSVSRR